MRLLKASTLEIEEFGHDQIPKYAILSHRWGKDELSLQDVEGGVLTKQGLKKEGLDKVRQFTSRANSDGFEYAWIDTCCIDKTSSAELSEAINSMYIWYDRAERCYAYLADVRSKDEFQESEWFSRGWTLQELLAPSDVYFFGYNWDYLGTKETLQQDISSRTGIPVNILLGDSDLETASIAQRMSWAAKRKTTRLEDRAYCLMGIFDINMPLIYGEGERAFARLQEEIIRVSDDHSLFAWEHGDSHGGLLATSPSAFERSGNVIQFNSSYALNSLLTISSKGVHLQLRFIGIGPRGLGLAILNCRERDGKDKPIAIYVRDTSLTMERFERVYSEKFERLDLRKFRPSQYPMRTVCIQIRRRRPIQKSKDVKGYNGIAQYNIYDDRTLLKLMDFADPTALIQAAQEGVEDNVWLLLTRGDIKVDLADEDGQTALSHAVRRCHTAVVKMLLPRSNVEAEDDSGRTVLSWAAGLGHEAIVKLLIEKDANVEAKDAEYGQTPLVWAVKNGHEAVVKLLVDKGADVEAKDFKGGPTSLVWAAKNGHEAVVKLLVDNGADVEAKESVYGQTPLSLAAEKGHEAVVKLLVDNSADVEAKDAEYGQTPLSWAAQEGHEAVVKLLAENGADVEAKDTGYGQTPLSWAAEKGHEAVVKLLVDNGADVEAKCNSGLTPLLWATQEGHKAVVKLLVEKGAHTRRTTCVCGSKMWIDGL
ncbi:hypothetical protein QQS21_007438 [Conoideocrella luteorostrata]|uniref:Heterokaryon incompatibility domain-containing protein n=1 Tax=Conoideocrella luteorostrata TaxID=1105319 RepID=A0AAJ0CL36_9HYPO|nr:hypothetical protein QQS21_007438 [Conoideocrella luteorostrata]